MRKGRREQVLKRKNFFPSLLVTFFLWAVLGGIIYLVEPEALGIIPLFFFLFFFALLFTCSLIFGKKRRGMVAAVALTLFLVLRYLGMGNVLNFLLIAGLAITIEVHFARNID